MRKLFSIVLGFVALIAFAGIACAAEGGAARFMGDGAVGSAYLACAIGMAIAAAGCGIGQGLGLKGACEGVARNPEASNKLTNTLMLGLAFIESLAIYTFVICLILIFMRPFG